MEKVLSENPSWWVVPPIGSELEQVDALARARTDTMRGLKVKDQTVGGYEWDLAGFRGEWAVSLALNIPIRLALSKTAQGLNEGDIADFVEVNSRKDADERRWDLCEQVRRIKPERLYVLAITAFWPKGVLIAGYARGEELLTSGKNYSLPSGVPIKILSRNKLRRFNSIFDEFKIKSFQKLRA